MLRVHQWAKNALIFVPLLLAHRFDLATLAGALTAFVSFGLCASATYIINDLLDIETDRRHPRKKRILQHRPGQPAAGGQRALW